MKTYDFTNRQVQLLREAINSYSEQCVYMYDDDREDKMSEMGDLYQMLSPQTYSHPSKLVAVVSTDDDYSIYPLCDY